MGKLVLRIVVCLACAAGGFVAWAGGIQPARTLLEGQVAPARALLEVVTGDMAKSRGPTAPAPAGATPSAPAQSKGGPGAPPSVTVSKPVVGKIIEWDEYTGRFDAVDSVDIRARVSGYLAEIHFKDGQIVKKGDLLYVVDPRPYERALEQANAEWTQSKTKAESASLDVERGKPLVDRKIMSEKVFDDRANALREAQSTIKVAEAKVKTAELDLLTTKIVAPVTGRISRSAMSVGGWVSAGAAANATLLTTVVSEDPIHIYVDISENNWIKYKRLGEKGQKIGGAQLGSNVGIALPDEQGFPHKGVVDFVDNRLDQATGTLRARAVVDNKVGTFSAGMFARVRIAASPEYSAVMLPDDAIGTDQTNKFVYTVAEDGTVARKTVTLGPIIDGLRVVRTGIVAADVVITKGLQRARPGIKVAPKVDQIKFAVVESPAAGPAPEAAAPAAQNAGGKPTAGAKSAAAPNDVRKQ